MSSQRFSITLFLLASLFALTNLTTAAPAVLDTLTSTGYAPVGPAILGIQAPLLNHTDSALTERGGFPDPWYMECFQIQNNLCPFRIDMTSQRENIMVTISAHDCRQLGFAYGTRGVTLGVDSELPWVLTVHTRKWDWHDLESADYAGHHIEPRTGINYFCKEAANEFGYSSCLLYFPCEA